MKVSLDLKLTALTFAMKLGAAAVAVALFIYLKRPAYALLLTAAVVVVPATVPPVDVDWLSVAVEGAAVDVVSKTKFSHVVRVQRVSP